MTSAEGSLGEQIRSARVAKGLGLRELARIIEKSPSYVTDIEYDRRVPSEAVLKSICAALDLDFDRMLALAGRLGDEADRYLKREPAAGVLLRRAQESGLKDKDLRQLIDQVDEMARRQPKKNDR
jgi:transcriptional regulator with XRE-family HTH domain